MTRTVRPVAILGGNRIPFARSNSCYAQAANPGLAGQRAGGVAAGAVLKHSRDVSLTHKAALGSALGHSFTATGGQGVAALLGSL
ncbi:MAG: hypothetical protein ACRDS1_03565 [Pseudonocardiaceae bacterium]